MLGLIKTIFKAMGLLLLLAVVLVAVIAYRGGFLREVQPQFAGSCEALELDGSAEDVLIDRERGLAYLSLIDRRSLVRGENVQGTVARVKLTARPFTVEQALNSKPDHFRPHGLSLYIDDSGRRHLFAINHPVNRGSQPEMVELFRESAPGRFDHVETFSTPLMNAPNDLAAVGPRQFYVANDAAEGRAKAAAQQFGIGFSTLVYVDGDDARVVADNIASGGGINAAADGLTLYVAETAAQRVRVLERVVPGGDVVDLARVGVAMSPDNIDVAENGELWVAGHPNTLQLIQHFINETPAPSKVVRITMNGEAVVKDVYADDGGRISASSVGATYENLLLIGSITDRKILVCTME
jgi:arylesterase/paraoxonase